MMRIGRCLSTAELLEGSPVLAPQAAQKIAVLSEEYSSRGDDMDASAFEEFTRHCQNIITSAGHLHIASIAPFARLVSCRPPRVRAHESFLSREVSQRLPLREGWKEALQALQREAVPLYIFSSGYGDLVAQVRDSSFTRLFHYPRVLCGAVAAAGGRRRSC